MKRIAYTRPDGGVSVVVPAPGFMAKFETEAEGLAAVKAKAVPSGATDVAECETADLPADRTFRPAWARSGTGAAVDMPTACAFWKAKIRAARTAKLKEMDEETKRLEGLVRLGRATQDDLTAHEEAKQVYRDLPNGPAGTDAQCDAATTPEDLEAVWPAGL